MRDPGSSERPVQPGPGLPRPGPRRGQHAGRQVKPGLRDAAVKQPAEQFLTEPALPVLAGPGGSAVIGQVLQPNGGVTRTRA